MTVLKQAALGLPVADLVRQVGISEQTFYRWKKQYAGLESDQVQEFKQLAEEWPAEEAGGGAQSGQSGSAGRAVKIKQFPGPRS